MAPAITITVRKKRSETGAKKVTRAANGPGLMRSGISMPIPWPAIRFSKRQTRSAPSARRVRVSGDRVPAREVHVGKTGSHRELELPDLHGA